jgi:hypothetical protein
VKGFLESPRLVPLRKSFADLALLGYDTITRQLRGKEADLVLLTFKSYTVEHIKDPFGIISGKRYEFMVHLEIPEDDELYVEGGVSARTIVKVEDEVSSIVSYSLLSTSTHQILEFDLEEDEEAELLQFCKENLPAS